MPAIDERCPKCNSDRVRRSASLLQHLYRVMTGDGKRYCLSCEKRWLLVPGK